MLLPRQAGLLALSAVAGVLAGCQSQPRMVIEKLPVSSILSPDAGKGATDVARSPRVAVGAPSRGEPGWAPEGPERSWKWVVIHHSASESGSAATFDKWHRARGWDELGYHFVVCNGNGGPDGRVEVGSRWTKQKHGAHTGGTPENAYNECGIGICLVGDFTGGPPSGAQLAALDRLLTFLTSRYGIDPDNVIGHRDAPCASTECPGDAMEKYLGRTIRPRLAWQLAAGR